MTRVIDDRALAVLREPDTELEQAIAVLAAAGHDPEAMTLGDGDRVLLALHREVTGRDVEVAATCGRCGVTSEVTLGPQTLPSRYPVCAVCGPGGGLREPAYRDLRGLPASPELAAVELLRRCTVGRPADPPALTDLDRVDGSLCGPMVFACAGCGEGVTCPVDVQTFALYGLLAVLDAYDTEIHLLARAYQWDLASIEALPRQRRRRLAELITEDR